MEGRWVLVDCAAHGTVREMLGSTLVDDGEYVGVKSAFVVVEERRRQVQAVSWSKRAPRVGTFPSEDQPLFLSLPNSRCTSTWRCVQSPGLTTGSRPMSRRAACNGPVLSFGDFVENRVLHGHSAARAMPGRTRKGGNEIHVWILIYNEPCPHAYNSRDVATTLVFIAIVHDGCNVSVVLLESRSCAHRQTVGWGSETSSLSLLCKNCGEIETICQCQSI